MSEEYQDPKSMVPKRQGGRPKGLPKTGGRVKGTPNKKTSAVLEIVEASGYSPINRLLEMAQEAYDEGNEEREIAIIGRLMPYVYAQRKPIDPDGMVSMEDVMTYIREHHIKVLSALNFVLNHSQIPMEARETIMSGMSNALTQDTSISARNGSA